MILVLYKLENVCIHQGYLKSSSPLSSLLADGRTDRQTENTKLIMLSSLCQNARKQEMCYKRVLIFTFVMLAGVACVNPHSAKH